MTWHGAAPLGQRAQGVWHGATIWRPAAVGPATSARPSVGGGMDGPRWWWWWWGHLTQGPPAPFSTGVVRSDSAPRAGHDASPNPSLRSRCSDVRRLQLPAGRRGQLRVRPRQGQRSTRLRSPASLAARGAAHPALSTATRRARSTSTRVCAPAAPRGLLDAPCPAPARSSTPCSPPPAGRLRQPHAAHHRLG